MRIIAGRCKGRRLDSPTWSGVRPTSDRLRETLFNVLASRVEGARVLDAYAGTGALGLEALSRGAALAVFVDHDRRSITLIGENARRCGVEEACVMIRAEAGHIGPHAPLGPYDLVFVDPPYAVADLGALVSTLGDMLSPGGLLVLEHARRRRAPQQAGALTCVRQVVAGDSSLALYAHRPAPGASTDDATRDTR